MLTTSSKLMHGKVYHQKAQTVLTIPKKRKGWVYERLRKTNVSIILELLQTRQYVAWYSVFLIAQWSTKSFNLQLFVEISQPSLELDCTMLGCVAVSSNLHSPQILSSIYLASYAKRQFTPQYMRQESNLSTNSASKLGKSASHASRNLLCHLSLEELVVSQSMRQHLTTSQFVR